MAPNKNTSKKTPPDSGKDSTNPSGTTASAASATNFTAQPFTTAAAAAAATSTIPPAIPATNNENNANTMNHPPNINNTSRTPPANVTPIANNIPIRNLRYPSELSYVANPDDRPFDDVWKFMSLTKLCESESGNTMNKILLLRVLYMMKASRGTENVFLQSKYKGQGGQNSIHGSFDRMLFCMDPFSRKTNICAFLIGHGQNMNLFSGNATMRDSKSGCGKCVMSNDIFLLLSDINHQLISHVHFFTDPGSLIVVENPPMVMHWMDTVPLLSIPGQIVPVISHSPLPMLPFDEHNDKQSGFFEKHVCIELNNLFVKGVNCCGNLCGALDMYKDGKEASSCPCYAMEKHDGNISGIFDMTMVFQGSPEKRHIKNFTSKPFTNFFFQDEKMPPSVTESSFERREQREVQNVVCRMLTFINGNGGFTITGWRRPGMKADQGVDAQNVPYAKDVKKTVVSGDIRLHICHITPSNVSMKDNAEMKAMRFKTNLLTGVVGNIDML